MGNAKQTIEHAQANTVLEGVDAIRYMSDIGFKEFLVVYGEKYAPKPDETKKPIGRWKDSRFTAEETIPYAQRGYWVSVIPDTEHVVIDIDLDDLMGTEEFELAKQRLLSVYGNTLWVETKRGVHFYFRYGKLERNLLGKVSGRHPSHVWSATDYQKETRYAIFVGDNRRVHPNPIQPLPEEFYVGLEFAKQHTPNLLMMREGNRNNMLFAIGRSIRSSLREHIDEMDAVDRASKAIERLNALMKEPLPAGELRDIQNSLSRPDREDFDFGGSFFRRNGQNTYRRTAKNEDEETIDMTDNPFTKVLSFAEIQSMRRDRRWFMHGLIKHGDVVLVAGAPKSGKSTFMRSVALSCVAEEHQPLLTSKGRVLWFVFEEHHEDIADRVELAQKRYGINPDLLHFVVFNPSSLSNPLPYFVAGLRQLLNNMSNDPPVAVIVDTVGRVFAGVDINDYTAVQQAIENIRWGIRDFSNPPVIFLVHHTNKSEYKTPLGSQAFQGSADAIFTLDFDEEGSFMQCVGRNVDPALQHRRIGLRFDPETMLIIGVGELSSAVCELVEKIHSGEISLLKVAENYQGGVFKADLKRLLRRGILLSDGEIISTNANHKDLHRYLDGAQKMREKRLLQDTANHNGRGEQIASNLLGETQEPSPAVVHPVPATVSAGSESAEEHGQGRNEGSYTDVRVQEPECVSGNGHDGHFGKTVCEERTGGDEGEGIPDAKDEILPADTERRKSGTAGRDTAETSGNEEQASSGRDGNGDAIEQTATADVLPPQGNVDETDGEEEQAETNVVYVSLDEIKAERKKEDKMRFIRNRLPLDLQSDQLVTLKSWGVKTVGKPADMTVEFPSAFRVSAWRVLHRLLSKNTEELIPLSAYYPFGDTTFQRAELDKNFAFVHRVWSKAIDVLNAEGTPKEQDNVRKAVDAIMHYVKMECQQGDDKPFTIQAEEDVLPLLNRVATVLIDLRLPVVFALWLQDEPLPFLFALRNGEWFFRPIRVADMRSGYLRWLEILRNGDGISPVRIDMDERLMWRGYLFHRASEEQEEQAGKPAYILSTKRVEIMDTEELIDYLCYVLGLSKEEVSRCAGYNDRRTAVSD